MGRRQQWSRIGLTERELDKSFVNHIPHAWAPTQIVSSVINLAHNLKLTVVAEGVETQEQLSFLKNAGCNQIQGYLYSRPLPVGEFESVLRSGVLTPGLQNNIPQKFTNKRKHFRVTLAPPLVGKVGARLYLN
ncbi:EAL domain-containing protein [Alicyclobacillus fastidiosus]|uniref:EAL domain-containing protein n=1 Tax=Alicyclobacillus fastidiosus TaxID=392011 RepID=UPI0034DD3E7B